MAATITVVCPQCKHKMRASAEHIGRRGRCPSCKALVEITPAPGEAPEPAAGKPRRFEARAVSTGTQANTLLAGLIGAVAAALLYGLIFYPLYKAETRRNAESGIGHFMCKRGFIQPSITLVTCWGLAILGLKYLTVQRERRAAELELDLIPLEIGLQINKENVDQFLDHIGKLPPAEQNSIMGRRIQGALQHFKHRNNVSEVQSFLSTQADLDASAVDSGYTLLRAFIWVCPILGFIGTVDGIGAAVTGLEKTLRTPSASAPEEPGAAAAKPAEGDLGQNMLRGMQEVTGGLAVAFDTTYLGLICVVFLMFPTEALRKIEYGMLDRVQEFANESLLRRMAEGEGEASADLPDIVRNTLAAAFKEHQRWLVQWQAQVGQLGEVIGRDFEASLASVQDKLVQSEAARMDSIARASKAVEELFQQVGGSGGNGFQASVQAMSQLQQSLTANTAQLNQVIGQQKQLAERYTAGDLGQVLHGLQQAIVQLNERIAAVEGTAPVTSVTAAPKGGLFSRFRGRNNG